MESDPNFGMFKGTGGLGLKLLMKMGYKPGEALGTTGEGIVKPLEPVVRPKNMGLAFGDFVEHVPSPKDEVKEVTEPTSTAFKKRTSSGRSSITQAYKKSKKVTPNYFTSKDLLKAPPPSVLISEELETQKPSSSIESQKLKIIDMRFSEPAEIEANQIFTPSTSNQEKVNLGPGVKYQVSEFVNKLSSVTDNSEIALRRAIAEKGQLSSKLLTHQEKITSLEKETRLMEARISKIRSLLTQIHTIHTSQDIEPMVHLLQSYRFEFPSLPIDALGCSLVTPYFRSLFNQWNPFEEPEIGIIDLNLVQNLLSALPITHSTSLSDVALPSVPNSVIPSSESRSVHLSNVSTKPTLYDALLWHVWLPRVRSAFLSDWDVYASDIALDFLDHWHPKTITPILYSFLRRHIILPKLQSSIESWNPFKDPSIHSWFIPWLTHHFSDLPLASYFPSLHHKLGCYFERFDPLDPLQNQTAISLFTPFKELWSSDTYTQFTQRYVVTRLQACLSKSLMINPADQDLTPIDAIILAWLPYLPLQHFIPILTSAFFPPWLQVLYDWLTSTSPNYEEIATWYETWKAYLPTELVSLGPIQAHFKIGLDMMRRALAGVTIPAPAKLIQHMPSTHSGVSSSSLPSLQRASVTFTFKDLLEKELERLGRMLIPTNLTEPSSSKPIYKLDSYLCYIDQSVLFIKLKDEWVPKDLYQLSQLFLSS